VRFGGESRAIGLACIAEEAVNLYGPGGHDDPETSHAIPALIRECLEARKIGAPTGVSTT